MFLAIAAALPVLFFPDGNGGFEARSGTAALRVETDGHSLRFAAGARIRLRLIGAGDSRPVGVSPSSSHVNLLTGRDPSSWRTGLPAFGEVRLPDVYPGIDWIQRWNGSAFEHDFMLAPNAEPARIRFSISGGRARLLDNGSIAVETPDGDAVYRAPLCYQDRNGKREPIDGRYVQLDRGEFGFVLSGRDPALPAVIDPVVSPPVFVGGNQREVAYRVAADAQNNVWAVGVTNGPVPSMMNPLRTDFRGPSEAMVVKYAANTRQVLFTTFIGGEGNDEAYGVAVDRNGDVYVTGATTSRDFPIVGGMQSALRGPSDAFLVKIDSAGRRILYSTFLGGSGADVSFGIHIPANGELLLTGVSFSNDFPTTANAYQRTVKPAAAGHWEAFYLRLNAAGTQVLAGTLFGGTGHDIPERILLAPNNEVVIGGMTESTDLPTTADAFQPRYGGAPGDVFVARLSMDATRLIYSTYLGGDNAEFFGGLAVDPANMIWVAGGTQSANLRGTPNAAMPVKPQETAPWIARIPPPVSARALSASSDRELFDRASLLSFLPGKLLQGMTIHPVNGTYFALVWTTQVLGNGGSVSRGRLVDALGNPIAINLNSDGIEVSFQVVDSALTPSGTVVLGGTQDDAGKVEDRNLAIGSVGIGVDTGGFAPSESFDPTLLESLDIDPVRGVRLRRNSAIALAFGESKDVRRLFDLGGVNPLTFDIAYSNRHGLFAPRQSLGLNRMHNFEDQLVIGPSTVTAILFPGRIIQFSALGNNYVHFNLAGRASRLIRSAAGFTLVDAETGAILQFDSSGRLISKADRNGNLHTVVRASGGDRIVEIIDGKGRRFTLQHNGELLSRVVDFVNRTYTFTYTNSTLTEIVDPLGGVTRFDHSNQGLPANLIKETVPIGRAIDTRTLDSAGRPIEITNGVGDVTRIQYTNPGTLTTITLPDAAMVTDTYMLSRYLAARSDGNGNVTKHSRESGGRLQACEYPGVATQRFSYNADSNVTSITDPNGNETRITWLTQMQDSLPFYVPVEVLFPDGAKRSATYDARGNLLTRTAENGAVSTYTYNASGQVLTVRQPNGDTTTYTYNADNTLASITAPGGAVTRYRYNNAKRVSEIVLPSGKTIQYGYDATDNVTSETDAAGKTTRFTYDANGNAIRREDRAGAVTTTTYDAADRPVSVAGPAGETRTEYNARGAVAAEAGGPGGPERHEYDKAGNRTKTTNCLDGATTFAYDPRNRVTTAGDGVRYSYDAAGNITGITLSSGGARTVVYNKRNLPVSVTAPDGGNTSFAWNSRGLPVRLTDPTGGAVTLEYDESGRLIQLTTPAGGIWKYQHDGANVISTTNPLGQTNRYVWDPATSTMSFSGAGGTGSILYGPNLEILRIQIGDQTPSMFAYDGELRLLEAPGVKLTRSPAGHIVESNGIKNEFDAAGRLISVTYSDGRTVKYDYDCAGNPVRVTDWTGAETKLTYDIQSRPIKIERPNGVTSEYAYDEHGRRTQIRHGDIYSQNLTWNSANQLIGASGIAPQEFKTEGFSRSFTYDAADRNQDATWDASGRPLRVGNIELKWDPSTNSVVISTGETMAQVTADGLGNITGFDTQRLVHNYAIGGGIPSVVAEGEAAVRWNVLSPGGQLLYWINADGSVAHPLQDQLGNTVAIVGAGGEVLASYVVGPMGESLSQADEPLYFSHSALYLRPHPLAKEVDVVSGGLRLQESAIDVRGSQINGLPELPPHSDFRSVLLPGSERQTASPPSAPAGCVAGSGGAHPPATNHPFRVNSVPPYDHSACGDCRAPFYEADRESRASGFCFGCRSRRDLGPSAGSVANPGFHLITGKANDHSSCGECHAPFYEADRESRASGLCLNCRSRLRLEIPGGSVRLIIDSAQPQNFPAPVAPLQPGCGSGPSILDEFKVNGKSRGVRGFC